ncbi:hypothetical protein MM326_15120 [Alkalihalobacillus sp. LMS6]|uniref:hypothetical protein n=1 Tax=Alkalihalobacillus sp. LMS6 TaxID=2924034 RepID=UPI0020D1E4CE|nr:hypothetical protein [Alkalihalobacillus sp. LMS6]UTR05427.1 hypothetical protein MM326_15120 [Alkalihalobacillus sp. LMS6]
MIYNIQLKNLDELVKLTQKADKLSDELQQVIQEINEFNVDVKVLSREKYQEY